MNKLTTDPKNSDAKIIAILAAVVMAAALRLVVHGLAASPEISVHLSPIKQADRAEVASLPGAKRDAAGS